VILARLLRRDIAGVGKKEIKNMPLIGKTLELAGTIFIDRNNSASAIEAMKPLVDAMRNQGKSVAISPEGTRSITPRLAAFKKGPFHLAMQAGVPIVPIVIHNAGDVAPKGDFVFRPATVEVDVLAPVDTSDWRSETIVEHVAEVRGMFLEALGQREDKYIASSPASRPAKMIKKKALKKKAPKKKATTKTVLKKKALIKKAPKPAGQRKIPVNKAPGKTVLKKKALKKKTLKKPAAGNSG
jgi:putative phosphoserine phosphatase/1-acylglycerol-3-phosphate O-acyltransferase